MFVLGGEGQLGPSVAANLAGAVSLRAMCWRKLYCLPFVVFKTLKMHHLMRTRPHMSSRVSHFSLDEVEHLSNGFGKMGRKYKSSRGSNHNGFTGTVVSQNGWDSDDDELKEDDVWGEQGSTSSWDHCSYQYSHVSSVPNCSAENGCTKKGSKGRKSWLSMEIQAVDATEKNGHVGVGFAALEAVHNGGKGCNGGWAPGFSTRKVKIPQYIGAGVVGGSGQSSGWHEKENGGNRRGVPQSAPVSMPVWPAKCGFSEPSGVADADDSSACDDEDGDYGDDDDDDGEDVRCGRLAPHEIVDRESARSQSTTFSVIEGAGRTLKGMDLRRVRNAVWSRTGFED